jgi:hypothetical protein
VLLQCKTMRFKVAAKITVETTFRCVSVNAYIWTAIAIGATHHFPTGSYAVDKRAPDKADKSKATNPMH